MRDLRVVEIVEGVLVDVLGIEPDEVVPYARICDDLGAGPAQLLTVLSLLGEPVQPTGVAAGAESDHGTRANGLPRTVEELVDRIEGRGSQVPGSITSERPKSGTGTPPARSWANA